MLQGVTTAIGTLLVVILILYLTYVGTKYVGKNMRGRSISGGGRYIQIVDQIMIGQESSVALVNISGQICLLGISSGQVTLLKEFQEEELVQLSHPDQEAAGVAGIDFKDIIERLKDRKK